MLGPFLSASSSLSRPSLDLLSLLPLRGHLGSGLTANRTNRPNASELYLAFDFVPRSPRPALCYRPLPALPPHLRNVEGDTARAPDAAPTGKT